MAKNIFITGASSGIGQQLAKEFAAKGHNLALAARRTEKLEALKADLLARFPSLKIECIELDVTDYSKVPVALTIASNFLGRLDTVIVNAGIDKAGKIGLGNFENDKAVIETNVIGAIATIDSAVAIFKQQNHGHIVVMASVAAFCGLPGMASYSASKAAIANFAQSARFELRKTPIKVTTIYPGYIDTAINQSIHSRPFLVDLETGARRIAQLIERKVSRSTAPVFPWNIISWLLRLLPEWFLARVLKAQH